MSNVHTLNDLNNGGGGGGGQGPPYGRMQGNQGMGGMGMEPADEESKQAAVMFQGLNFMSVSQGGASAGKPARKENYWDMWKTTFCPQFSIVSFTFMCWAINTLVYLASLVFMVSPNKELNPAVFLGPDLRTLHAWGALDRFEIKENW